MKRLRIGRTGLGRIAVVSGVLFAMFIAITAFSPAAFGEGGEHPRIITGLTVILEKLDKQLETLQARPGEGFPALEKQLEAIDNLLSNLLDELSTPPEAGKTPPVKEQIVKLDLMLHRLVFVLEGIIDRVDGGGPKPPGKARAALGELRIWIDGYITGLTARMDRVEAREFEELAHAMLSDIGKHIARMAKQFAPKEQEKGRLEVMVSRIKVLLSRLDVYIIRTFGRPPAANPSSIP